MANPFLYINNQDIQNTERKRRRIYILLKANTTQVKDYDDITKMRLNRIRYKAIVESITGYNLIEYSHPKYVRKIYLGLLRFIDKNKENLKNSTEMDIRDYISYYSKCPLGNYVINTHELTDLVYFIDILWQNGLGLDHDF